MKLIQHLIKSATVVFLLIFASSTSESNIAEGAGPEYVFDMVTIYHGGCASEQMLICNNPGDECAVQGASCIYSD